MSEKYVKCVYCGATIEELRSNNPADGLHCGYEKYTDENPKYCCSNCNNIITHTNRVFANMLRSEYSPDRVAFELRQTADYIKNNTKELSDYYFARRIDRNEN